MTEKQKFRNFVAEKLKEAENGYGSHSYNALKMVLDFIDSQPEEPISSNLEEAAKKAYPDDIHKQSIFIQGALWQKKEIYLDLTNKMRVVKEKMEITSLEDLGIDIILNSKLK